MAPAIRSPLTCLFVMLATLQIHRAESTRWEETHFPSQLREDYYPLNPGAHWTYEVTLSDGGDVVTHTLTIKRIEHDEGRLIYTISDSGKKNLGDIYLIDDGNGIYLDGLDKDLFWGISIRVRFDPDLPIFPAFLYPGLRVNAETTAKSLIENESLRVNLQVLRRETIEVPAGAFDCMVARITRTIADKKTLTTDVWYVPSKGIVKYTSTKSSGVLSNYSLRPSPKPRGTGDAGHGPGPPS